MGGGVQPHFCPWKNVCFPIFSHGEKWGWTPPHPPIICIMYIIHSAINNNIISKFIFHYKLVHFFYLPSNFVLRKQTFYKGAKVQALIDVVMVTCRYHNIIIEHVQKYYTVDCMLLCSFLFRVYKIPTKRDGEVVYSPHFIVFSVFFLCLYVA